MGKKARKDSTEGMTEEEKLAYEEMKRYAEEEMKRKKEHLLKVFMKVKMKPNWIETLVDHFLSN